VEDKGGEIGTSGDGGVREEGRGGGWGLRGKGRREAGGEEGIREEKVNPI